MYALGQTVDCSDPAQIANAECGAGNDNAIDWNTLLQQGLTDVTQIFRPGTPSPVRTYLPAQPASAALTSPFFYIALLGGAYLLMKRR